MTRPSVDQLGFCFGVSHTHISSEDVFADGIDSDREGAWLERSGWRVTRSGLPDLPNSEVNTPGPTLLSSSFTLTLTTTTHSSSSLSTTIPPSKYYVSLMSKSMLTLADFFNLGLQCPISPWSATHPSPQGHSFHASADLQHCMHAARVFVAYQRRSPARQLGT